MPPMDERRDNPPMPYEQFRDKQLREAASTIAVCVLASLLIAGIVWPWKHEWACVPFCVLFLGGAWLLTGKRGAE